MVLQQSAPGRNFLSREGLAVPQNDACVRPAACAARCGVRWTARQRPRQRWRRKRKKFMSERATLDGTKRYAESLRGRAAGGHFREVHGMVLSSLGIGTYLGQPDERTDAAYTAAIVAALENGINVADAAINYRFQRSERSIGAALVQLEAKGYPRDQVIVCTKAGYLTPDGKMPADPNQYFFHEYIQRGVFNAKDIAAGSH